MLKISAMTSGTPQGSEVLEKSSGSNCPSTKLLIFVLFVLCAVCQVQILVNREGSLNVAHILREIQQTSERIADIELSLIKLESTLDFLLAEWGVKPTAHSRTKRQSGSSIRQEMRHLKRYLKLLDRRVQCVMSDNGTDGRGNPCPGGTGGKTGYLNSKQKEGRTNSTTQRPTQKPTKYRGATTSNSQISSQTSSKTTKRKQSTMYTYWGSSKCPRTVKTVHSGRVASSHSRSNPAVGSDYLCVPDSFEYTDYKNVTSELYLSPVKYGANMTMFVMFSAENCKSIGETCETLKKSNPRMFRILDYHQVPCAVCQHERRSATFVTPGRNMCHPGMDKEYHGYLMTGQHGSARSQHICVSANADGIPGSNTTRSHGPFLQPVTYKCDEPSCPQNVDVAENRVMAMTCVVCSV